MPRTDTDRDRGRLRAAILVAIGLHGLALALFAFLPARGGAWVADSAASGRGVTGNPNGAGGLAGQARSAGTRAIPILVAPLEREGDPPRGANPSRPANDHQAESAGAITGTSATAIDANGARDTDGASDSESVAEIPGGLEGAMGTGDAATSGDGSGGSNAADGIGAAGGMRGASGADSLGMAQRAFADWLDAAIRARLFYPERARARNAAGTVIVALTVPADGSRCDALVAKSSGSAILDRAAIELLRSLFPAEIAPGSPFSAPVRISFTLTPSPAP